MAAIVAILVNVSVIGVEDVSLISWRGVTLMSEPATTGQVGAH